MLTAICMATGYGFLVAFALFGLKRGNRRANLYLGFFVVLLSGSIILHALQYVGTLKFYPHLSLFHASFGFLFGPLLYFHIGALTDPAGRWSRREFLRRHALPFYLHLGYLIPFYLEAPGSKGTGSTGLPVPGGQPIPFSKWTI